MRGPPSPLPAVLLVLCAALAHAAARPDHKLLQSAGAGSTTILTIDPGCAGFDDAQDLAQFMDEALQGTPRAAAEVGTAAPPVQPGAHQYAPRRHNPPERQS